MKQPVSIVVWGGHDRSQLYAGSTEGGNSDLSVQNEYQKKQELLFTGGSRNVLRTPDVTDDVITSSYSDLTKWHGYSKAVIEESTLTELPFVTRFNLGILSAKKEPLHSIINGTTSDYRIYYRHGVGGSTTEME